MPAGGFGNLIALPLQSDPRQKGNSVFVDDELRPYDDQWAFLSSHRRMSRAEVTTLVEHASIAGVMPARVEVVLSNQVYIDRSKLPPALVNRLIRCHSACNIDPLSRGIG